MLRMFSGIQPTNQLTIGNYIGAIKNWVKNQHDYHSLFCIVDLHALTAVRKVENLAKNTLYNAAIYIAAGIDPVECPIFVQSHVRATSELNWLLNCFTYMGELNRMTQFKSKSKESGENIGVGLFTYPVLMAADILIFQSDLIPVGEDQRQHLELARDIALRINRYYDQEIFKMPKDYIPKLGAKIMDLQDPESKMSKSALNAKGTIFLTDSDKEIMQKVKSAVTDSGDSVTDDENKISAGLLNLMTMQAIFLEKSVHEIWKGYIGRQYGYVKVETAEIIINNLRPLRDKTYKLLEDERYLLERLEDGANKASVIAEKTLKNFKEKLGLLVYS